MSPVETGGRAARLVAWTGAAAAGGLCAFAVAGSLSATPTFDPVDMRVRPAAVALLAMTTLSFAGVGALVASRVRGNAIGWLLLGIGVALGVTIAAIEYVALDLPGARWADWPTTWVSLGPFVLIIYVMLLFPDGALVSLRWRPALWLIHLAAAAVLLQTVTPYTTPGKGFTNPVGVQAFRGTVFADNQLGFILLPFATVAGVASVVVRFRRSVGPQREQLKWFVFAGSLVAGGYLLQNATWLLQGVLGKGVAGAGLLLLVACFAAVPVGSGIAILRYRLYDVDRVVSRSVAYLLVTGIVITVYVSVIAIATAVLPGSSQVSVAAATLVSAAAFNPLRHRVQARVDRRFNRPHHDAVKLVEAFAAQLRTAVSVDGVRSHLSEAAGRAVEPTYLSIWTPQPPPADATADHGRYVAEVERGGGFVGRAPGSPD